MTITKIVGTLSLALALAMAVPMQAGASDKEDRRKAAAVIGTIIGIAAIAASSKNHRHEHHRHHGGNRHAYGAPFSPRPNVTCYPRQRVCYRRNGRIAGRATQRYFGG